ncbi:hypothetical protein D3C78_1249310 [compost metagenome]
MRNPLVVNLLVSVIHELGRHSAANFAIRILGSQYQRDDNRSPWQCWHDWHTSQERDEGIRQALEYCGLGGEVLSLRSLPHGRQLQLQLRSGKQLTIQFDQGLSYWEAERSEKSHLRRFDFKARQLGDEIMLRITGKVVAADADSTQIFISVSP